MRITTDMDPERALWSGTGIPKRYRHLGVNHALFTSRATSELDAVTEWLRCLPEQQRTNSDDTPLHPQTYGQGLLLAGPPGTGKTTTAAAIACDVRRSLRSVYYTRYPDYVDRERTVIANRDGANQEQLSQAYSAIERVAQSMLVVLDDVGHEHLTSSRFAEDTLEKILRNRFSAGRPTVITTNLTGDHWRGRYSAALRSFVAEATRLVPFLGDDLRGRGHA
ncbi:ATP-binding protein [Saccharothrix sp. ST-888]|uniref:ATP-binding protein n=1 Tax=Saccharothrix sp. ST-888 TaxID=1427391 RepID=UPI0005EC3491|nr:ATP-binding protein [Saccharothrix sp. ST-888]KJK55533.1 hypothetical protein UK12_28115 [Saccharothrix sp. ST-888]